MAALARHVLLKAPDKAEFRASAVDGAVALALVLDSAEQQQLVAFVARLSRTPKVQEMHGRGCWPESLAGMCISSCHHTPHSKPAFSCNVHCNNGSSA